MNNQKKAYVLTFYIIIFYAVWAGFELIVKDFLDNNIANVNLCQFIKSGIIKNLVWTLPAIILIRHFKNDVYISLKEMFNIRCNWLKYLPIFIIFTIYLLAGSLLQNGKITISDDFGTDKIIIVIFVGLTEETVFRGLLLNAAIRKDRIWIYIIINAVMFLLIHFPFWIHQGIFISNFTEFAFLSVLALSVIFSWTFIKSRNIIIPILLHMYWDLLMFMFY